MYISNNNRSVCDSGLDNSTEAALGRKFEEFYFLLTLPNARNAFNANALSYVARICYF